MKTEKFRYTFTVPYPPLPTHPFWPSEQVKIPLEERRERGERPHRKRWMEKGISVQPEQGGPVSVAGQLPEAIQSLDTWGWFIALLCCRVNYPRLVTLLPVSDTQSSQHATHCLSVSNDQPLSQQRLCHLPPHGLHAFSWPFCGHHWQPSSKQDWTRYKAGAFSSWVGCWGNTPHCIPNWGWAIWRGQNLRTGKDGGGLHLLLSSHFKDHQLTLQTLPPEMPPRTLLSR